MAKKIVKKQQKKRPKKATKNGKRAKKTPLIQKPSPIKPKISASLIESRTIVLAGSSTSIIEPPETHQTFDIELSDIDGDTTIGDLLVVFPRTRDVLFKHGISFEVEEAGYVYMTLNVFSAMHGLKIKNLLEELLTASKEAPPVPSATQPQSGRPVTVAAPLT